MRLAEPRATQAALAAAYGVEEFGYWQLPWFAGPELLLEPAVQRRGLARPGAARLSFCSPGPTRDGPDVWNGRTTDVSSSLSALPGHADERAIYAFSSELSRRRRYGTSVESAFVRHIAPRDLRKRGALADTFRHPRSPSPTGSHGITSSASRPSGWRLAEHGFRREKYMCEPGDAEALCWRSS